MSVRREGIYPPDQKRWTAVQRVEAASNMLLEHTCNHCTKALECPLSADAFSCWLWVERKTWEMRAQEKWKRNVAKRVNKRTREPWNTGRPRESAKRKQMNPPKSPDPATATLLEKAFVETDTTKPKFPRNPWFWGAEEKGKAAENALLDHTCENCAKWSNCPFKDHSWLSCAEWDKIPDIGKVLPLLMMPLIRRVYPNMIASQLAVCAPSDSIYYLKPVYGRRKGIVGCAAVVVDRIKATLARFKGRHR